MSEVAVSKGGVLLVGNFLSGSLGARSVGEDLGDRLTIAGWRVITTSGKLNRIVRVFDMALTAWRRRSEYGVAAVDLYSGWSFVWAEVVCAVLRLARKPYILTLRGGALPTFSKRWPRRVRRLLRSAHAITTPSSYLMDEMAPFAPPMRLLPNPIDLAAYPFRLRERPAPRLVWLRSFHHVYNPALAPETLALLVGDYPEATLLMVGRDKEDGSLEATWAMARARGVEPRLSIPGGVKKSEVPGILDRGDIFLNTTNFDNMPVSVLEAMACGLCVISTDVGGIPYLLTHEQDALLVPPADAAAMAEAVRRVLTDTGLAACLSRSGRARAEQFDWSNIFPQWEELLETVKLNSLRQEKRSTKPA